MCIRDRVYGEATITRDDRDITLKGQKEITIHVVESGYLFVGVDGVPETKTGEEVPALELSYNDLDVKNVAVYKAVAGTNLEATYKKTTFNEDGDPLRIETSSTTRFDVNDEDNVTTIQNRGKGTGTMKLSIKSATGSDKSKFNTTEESTTATILKRIDVTGNVTIDKDGSKTTISPYASAPNMDSDSNVAGYDIKVLKLSLIHISQDRTVSVREEDFNSGVKTVYRGRVGWHRFTWSVRRGGALVQQAFRDENGFELVHFGERGEPVSKARFSLELRWESTAYYMDGRRDQLPAAVLSPVADGLLLTEWNPDSGKYSRIKLVPCALRRGTPEQSLADARLGEPLSLIHI